MASSREDDDGRATRWETRRETIFFGLRASDFAVGVDRARARRASRER